MPRQKAKTTVKRAKKTAPKKKAAAAKPRAPRKKKQPVVVPSEAAAEESKYYAGPVIQKFEEIRPFEFPPGYGDNRIVAMVRDPFWLFVYWEVSRAEWLRVYDTENWESFDIEITGGASRWYIKVPACNRTYCVEVGYKMADGNFVALARSNWVTTPLDRMSDVIDEQWLLPDWERLYALSGGSGLGHSSGWVSSRFSP